MTGPEFARDHHNDSSTWKPADFDAITVLVDLDIHRLRQLNKQPPPHRLTPADLDIEQHLAEASLLPPLHSTQPTPAA